MAAIFPESEKQISILAFLYDFYGCSSIVISLNIIFEVFSCKYEKLCRNTVHTVTVTGKHGSNYRLSLSCNRKSKKLDLTNLFNSQQ